MGAPRKSRLGSARRNRQLAGLVGRPRLRPSREGESCGKRSGPAMALADYFPAAGKPAFPSRGKIAGRRHPSLRCGRSASASPVQARPARRLSRHEGRDRRGPSEQGSRHDDPSIRIPQRIRASLISHRPPSQRTPALWLSSLRRRAGPQTSARTRFGGRRDRRHLRRPCRHPFRDAPRAGPR